MPPFLKNYDVEYNISLDSISNALDVFNTTITRRPLFVELSELPKWIYNFSCHAIDRNIEQKSDSQSL